MSLIVAADNLNVLNPAMALGVLAGAGLDVALVDVLQPGMMETIQVINQLI
jgi:hypothetical protein